MKAKKGPMATRGSSGTKNGLKRRLLRKCAKPGSYTTSPSKRQISKKAPPPASLKIKIKKNKKRGGRLVVSAVEMEPQVRSEATGIVLTPRSRRKAVIKSRVAELEEEPVPESKLVKNGSSAQEPKFARAGMLASEPTVDDKNGKTREGGQTENLETEINSLKLALAENGITIVMKPLKDCNAMDEEMKRKDAGKEGSKGGDELESPGMRPRRPTWTFVNGSAEMKSSSWTKEAEAKVEAAKREEVLESTSGKVPVRERDNGKVSEPKKLKTEDLVKLTCGDLTISCSGGGPLPKDILPELRSPNGKKTIEFEKKPIAVELVDLAKVVVEDEPRYDLSPQIAYEEPEETEPDDRPESEHEPDGREDTKTEQQKMSTIPTEEPAVNVEVEQRGKIDEEEVMEVDGELDEPHAAAEPLPLVISMKLHIPPASPPRLADAEPHCGEVEPEILVECCCRESTDHDIRMQFAGSDSCNDVETFCQAIDIIDGGRIGCYRVVTSDMKLYRVAKRCPFVLLCNQHFLRLKLHQCCPICGCFCTDGTGIMLCTGSPKDHEKTKRRRGGEDHWTSHLFHKKCAMLEIFKRQQVARQEIFGVEELENLMEATSPEYQDELISKIKCPHCTDAEDIKEISLKFKASNPVSVPDRPEAIRKFAITVPRSTTFMNSVEQETLRFFERTTAAELARANSEANDLASAMKIISSKKNFLKCLKKNDMASMLAIIQHSIGTNRQNLVNARFKSLHGQSALHLAVANKNICMVHALIMSKANPNAMDDNFVTPLVLAVRLDLAPIAKYLIAAGAEKFHVGQNGATAVHLAAEIGNLAVLQGILEDHEDMLSVTDNRGLTALMYAAQSGKVDVVNFLAGFSSDTSHVQAVDRDQNTPLHWAAASGATEAVRILIKYAAEVDAVNTFGRTPLHTAVIQGHEGCVLMLLVNQADLSVTDFEGKSALDYCDVGVHSMVSDRGSLSGSNSPNLPVNRDAIKLCLLQTMTIRAKLASQTRIVGHPVLSRDISLGKERSRRISCINTVDDSKLPSTFKYITTRIFSSKCLGTPVVNVDKMHCCDCSNSSAGSQAGRPTTGPAQVCTKGSCGCAANGYDSLQRLNLGAGLEDGANVCLPMVQECNELCGCDARACGNRVFQDGAKCDLEVFRTKGKGWGVRTVRKVPRGTFVCSYVGEVVDRLEASERSQTYEETYAFDIHGGVVFMDATKYGNVARFLNHSCDPNLVAVKVMFDHQDKRFPHIALFAKNEIDAGEELSFDYGEKFWDSKIVNGIFCKCGSSDCKYKTGGEESGPSDGDDAAASDFESSCSSLSGDDESDKSLV